MGIMDVFKRGNPVERAVKDLREPYAQPDVRRAAMGKLLELATPEAYAGLLVRFTFVCNGHIADESEKRDLVDELVNVGLPAVDGIKAFIKKEKLIGFPIRALARILSRDETLTFLLDTLQGMDPTDHRTVEQKKAIVQAVSDLGSAHHAPAIVRYLGDLADDVQSEVLSTLEHLKNPETYPAIAQVCVGDTHAARVQRRAAEVLAGLEVAVKDVYPQFNPELRLEWSLGKGGTLVKGGAKKA